MGKEEEKRGSGASFTPLRGLFRSCCAKGKKEIHLWEERREGGGEIDSEARVTNSAFFLRVWTWARKERKGRVSWQKGKENDLRRRRAKRARREFHLSDEGKEKRSRARKDADGPFRACASTRGARAISAQQKKKRGKNNT